MVKRASAFKFFTALAGGHYRQCNVDDTVEVWWGSTGALAQLGMSDAGKSRHSADIVEAVKMTHNRPRPVGFAAPRNEPPDVLG